MKDFVSVIIPNFNYGEYLGCAIDSVLSQSWEEFEVIVVDNFSTDNSATVAKTRRDARVRFVKFDNGGSIARARNFGVQLARGNLIAFLDSDDLMQPQKLLRQVSDVRRGVDVSYHSVRFIGRKSGTFKAWKISHENSLVDLLAGGNPIVTSTVLMKKELFEKVGGFPEEAGVLSAEDYGLWLKLALAKAQFRAIKSVLGSYRVHNSISKRMDGPGATFLASKPFRVHVTSSTIKKHDAFLNYARGVHAISSGQRPLHRDYMMKAASGAVWRFRWRALARLLAFWQ